jgi:Coenzyme PQQ synthesis protein D (PqqD)
MTADRPRRAVGIDLAELGHGLLVRQAQPPRVHLLNNTASMVLEMCDGRHTVAEIAAALGEAFTLDAPPLAEAAACVSGLRQAGVLVNSVGHPFDFFAAIYCLNLDHQPVRFENATRRFAALNIAARVERFSAVSTPRNHPSSPAWTGTCCTWAAPPGSHSRTRPGAWRSTGRGH